jgi:hypothetical protein
VSVRKKLELPAKFQLFRLSGKNESPGKKLQTFEKLINMLFGPFHGQLFKAGNPLPDT